MALETTRPQTSSPGALVLAVIVACHAVDGTKRIVSDGTATKPHCSWMSRCTWSGPMQNECAQQLCIASGYPLGGAFVSASNNPCSSGFIHTAAHFWVWDQDRIYHGNLNKDAQVTADCVEPTPAPTRAPTTLAPTHAPTTLAPTHSPTFAPTQRPTRTPTYDAEYTVVVSDGTAQRPHCSWSSQCAWTPLEHDKCAQALCSASGYSEYVFVGASNNPCSVSFVHTSAYFYLMDRGVTQFANMVKDARIIARCANPPTHAPTSAPTTLTPTTAPTDSPSDAPTNSPSDAPTAAPTDVPSYVPSDSPTDMPTRVPTVMPSDMPSDAPTMAPSDAPTMAPSDAPTQAPTVVGGSSGTGAATGAQGSGSSSGTVVIAGAAAAGLVLLLCIGFVLLCRRRRDEKERDQPSAGMTFKSSGPYPGTDYRANFTNPMYTETDANADDIEELYESPELAKKPVPNMYDIYDASESPTKGEKGDKGYLDVDPDEEDYSLPQEPSLLSSDSEEERVYEFDQYEDTMF